MANKYSGGTVPTLNCRRASHRLIALLGPHVAVLTYLSSMCISLHTVSYNILYSRPGSLYFPRYIFQAIILRHHNVGAWALAR